jgi:hypothetical protein
MAGRVQLAMKAPRAYLSRVGGALFACVVYPNLEERATKPKRPGEAQGRNAVAALRGTQGRVSRPGRGRTPVSIHPIREVPFETAIRHG